MSTLLKCITKGYESALKVKEQLGVSFKRVSIVTRTWNKEIGSGTPKDTEIEITPRPCVNDPAHDIRLQEAGAIKEGDLIVTEILKLHYPDESFIDAQTNPDKQNIERFYKIGDYLYKSIHVKEKFATWEVHVRRLSSQEDFS